MLSALISEELTIEGDLESKGSIDVSGQIVGDVVAAKIEVLEGGHLSGSVKADEFVVRGQYTGDAKCSSVTIAAGATVRTNITAKRLSCESGAEISGRLEIIDN
jgi:cytoskeletal protein CcmA (bactofilin family)